VEVKFMLFTPDGNTLAAAAEDESGGTSIKLWRAADTKVETARRQR
jgi:hypothetical protein